MNYIDERHESQLLNEFFNQKSIKEETLEKILKNKRKYQESKKYKPFIQKPQNEK